MKKWFIGIIFVLIVVGAIGIYVYASRYFGGPTHRDLDFAPTVAPAVESAPKQAFAVVASKLDTPWAFAFLPDRTMLFTERPGNIRIVNADGSLRERVIPVDRVLEKGEGGLLGIAVDPKFAQNQYLYLYSTYAANGDNTRNHVVRYTFDGTAITDQKIIVDAIPGAANHNGGALAFGPDGYLYITTGDAQEPSRAQNIDSLAGKILRVDTSGAPAPGNPFDNRVFSYGHRNPQGIAWDAQGQLWATEHGRSGIQSGFDEVNLIIKGGNYGWPDIQGDATRPGMIAPVVNSGPNTTWAPSGAAVFGNSLFFAGLRGVTLYEAQLDGSRITSVKTHLVGEYGRLRAVARGPDGYLYLSTSNRDGRGKPTAADDQIFRIDPAQLN